MKCLCALLVLVASATAIKVGNRIVGGQPAIIQQFPYQVSIQHNNRHICGGALVKPNKVLTAAHCVSTYTPSVVFVRVGSTYHAQGGIKVPTRSYTIHPEYNSNFKQCDIAVLTLSSSVQSSATISPVSLVGIGKKPQHGSMITIPGWGNTQYAEGPNSVSLRAIRLSVVGNVICAGRYSDDLTFPYVSDRTFCAGDGSSGPYLGDSGSAVVNDNGQLAGIVSWGNDFPNGGHPTVITDLSHAVIRRYVDDNLIS